MKVVILFFALCMGFSSATAQVVRIDTVAYPDPVIPKTKKNNFNIDYLYTLAVRTYGYEQFPQLLNQAELPFLSSYLNGIMFKYNDNQIGYRLQANYFDHNIGFENECEGCAWANGRLQNTAIKIGMEKSISYARLQPYFGADIGFMTQRFKGSSINYGTAEQVYVDDIKNAALLSPLVGFKLYIIPRVAISAEANFNVAYSYQKLNAYANEALSGPPTQSRRYKWEFFFAPVSSISLQYSFGLINQ